MSEKNWSTQQQDIFSFFRSGAGNLVVRARAGTGKTTTIVEACGHAEHEEKILLAAFNKKIATELQQRVSAANVEAKTLHALGYSFIRRQWSNARPDDDIDFERARLAAGRNAPDEMVVLTKKLAALLKSIDPFTTDAEVAEEIAERFDLTPEDEWEEEGWDTGVLAAAAIKARDLAKERDEMGRISFDDMVFVPVALGFVRPHYSMVVIDEAQDMNTAQLLLAQGACKKSGRVVVVGDDRQAIYGFRGADSGSLDRLKKELSAKELGLTTTYRCGRAIVAQANRLVPDFHAGENNPLGTVDHIQIDAIVNQAKPGDFVLSRANAPLMGLCLAFLKKGIRARIEGRDVAKALKNTILGFKAKSVAAFMERVDGWQKKQGQRALKMKNSQAREKKLEEISDQADMLRGLADGAASVNEILTRTENLFGDTDANAPVQHVVLSSVHRSKGLEADRVFIIAETIRGGSDEELNIEYVAITRARKHLTWVGQKKARKS